tara:strand:- start:1473 stop:1694 length:222 start_codon:yes stop_codon:yes gene_type:complete
LNKVTCFGDEFIGAEVSQTGDNMHTVNYIREGEIIFSNYVFNDNLESGRLDSIEMATKFVESEKLKNGKQCLQ